MQSCQLSNYTRSHKQSGFSLIELVVTIAIMAIMMAIALPAFSVWREKTAAKTAADTLVAHLKQARIEAISENRSVTIALASNFYTVDSGAATPRTVQLSKYSKNLGLTHSGGSTFSFGSGGTSANKTITITNSTGKNWAITINQIGRVYIQ